MSQKQNDLISLNQYSKEMDDLYHNYASRHGLSDAALWSLYYIWECNNDDHLCTQKEIRESWSYSPQTTNSALKALEERGFVKLEPTPENRKSKQIRLTSMGHALAEQVIVPLVNAELEAFSTLDAREKQEYIRLTEKFTTALKEKINQI